MSQFLNFNNRARFSRKRSLKLRLLSNFSNLVILAVIALGLISFTLFIWYSKDLPTPDKIRRKEGFSTVILDRDSKPVYDIYTDKDRIPVAFSDFPDTLKKATIAVEDKDFYKHQGFDPKGILRAFFHIITLRGVQGGSTLTQQLVKNVLLSSEQTLPRKIKEFVLAVQIERKYTKDEILQMYLNESPYGGTFWGIESAAKGYFGKHAKNLTLPESVVLAGLPQRPSYYSPFGNNPTAYIKRSEEVLRRMREDNYISQSQEYELKRQLKEVKFVSGSSQLVAPHFVAYVKKQLTDILGESVVNKGGLKVFTTLDLDLQTKSMSAVKEEVEKLKGLKVSNGAALVTDPQTGEILAYVGSREYESDDPEFTGKFDIVSLGLRQPGSALKPITYAVAFNKGYTPATLIMDVETHFPGGANREDYVPKNYDGKFRGPVQLRFALGNSINIPAVKMTALVGIKDILKTAYEMGLTTLEPTDDNVRKFGLSLTLGGGEIRLIDLVQAYAVLGNSGVRQEIFAINKVEDLSGNTLYEHKKIAGKRILNEDITFLISHILLDNNSRKEVFGERSYLVIPGKSVSVKTGTTDDKKDNWAVGYTSSVAVGVWVGNNDNTPMHPSLVSGTSGAAPIWSRIMKEALRERTGEVPKQPDNVISLTIDAYAGGLPREGRPTRSEYFIRGTEPTVISPIYQKLKISRADNNKLANQVEIAQGAYEEKDFLVFKEDDPTSLDGKNRWQEAINEWLVKQSDLLYHPPTEISSNNENTVVVVIKKPHDQSQIDDNNIEVVAEGKATREIKKMEFFIDDSLKKTFNSNSFAESFSFETGIRKIKVKAYNEKGNSGESEITIGVKVPAQPSVTPLPTPTASSEEN